MVKLIHISKQRYEFIMSQGYRLTTKTAEVGAPFKMVDPNTTTYHILDDEFGYCEKCREPFTSVDANSPVELEIIKSFDAGRAVIILRNQRQADILMVREYLTRAA